MSRLLTYAAIGIISGLLVENKALIVKQCAKDKARRMKKDLDQAWFAWSGPTDVEAGSNLTAYYRVQGPHLVIEYAPQGGDPAMHIHTMYRDPTNDYGAKFK